MDLVEIDEGRGGEWDRLVASCPYATPFDCWEWRRALSAGFPGMKPIYLGVESGGELVALMPMFIFKPLPLLKTALSMPWDLFGGPILMGDASRDPDLIRFCILSMEERARSEGASELVITRPPLSPPPLRSELERWAEGRRVRFTHLLKLHPDFDLIWRAYNRRVRTAVRKARRLGVRAVFTKSEGKLREFYGIYLDLMRRFGSPPKPFDLLREVMLSPIGGFITAELEGRVIAGLLYICFGGTITLWCGASLTEYRSYRPNNLIFNEVIMWGCRNGYRWVDFGASPPEREGLVKFKEEWRAVRHDFEVYHKTLLPGRREVWVRMEPILRRVYSLLLSRRGSG